LEFNNEKLRKCNFERKKLLENNNFNFISNDFAKDDETLKILSKCIEEVIIVSRVYDINTIQ
jgi:hypothetical protein